MTVELVEAKGPGEVGDDRRLHGFDDSGHIGHSRIGGCDHQQVDAVGGTRQVVRPPERDLDPPPGGGERSAEREAGPPRADDA